MSEAEEKYRLPPSEKIGPLLHALDARYGRKHRSDGADTLTVLIRGVLSQNTSDVNSGRAYGSLKEQFPDWQDLAAAESEEVEEAIRGGGLAAQKAATIQAVMEWLGKRGDYSLDFLAELDNQEAEERLTRIKGVGIKTARLVLLFGLDRQVFVVDTHVHRLSRRLGLIPEKATRRKAHALLDELVPGEDKYSGHLNMIEHGRQTCLARSPRCDECIVRPWCLYVRDAEFPA